MAALSSLSEIPNVGRTLRLSTTDGAWVTGGSACDDDALTSADPVVAL